VNTKWRCCCCCWWWYSYVTTSSIARQYDIMYIFAYNMKPNSSPANIPTSSCIGLRTLLKWQSTVMFWKRWAFLHAANSFLRTYYMMFRASSEAGCIFCYNAMNGGPSVDSLLACHTRVLYRWGRGRGWKRMLTLYPPPTKPRQMRLTNKCFLLFSCALNIPKE